MPCVAFGSLRGWQVCCGISGNFAVECAASLLWNQWQVLRGISGNFRMERVATFARNTQTGRVQHLVPWVQDVLDQARERQAQLETLRQQRAAAKVAPDGVPTVMEQKTSIRC